MAAAREILDVTIVLVNEGYISTAIGPIEVFSAAGSMWDEMSGRTPLPQAQLFITLSHRSNTIAGVALVS